MTITTSEIEEYLTEHTPREAFNLTDAGNGQRFARGHGTDVRYVYAWSCWLIWDGRRWIRDAGDGIMARAKAAARAIYAEAATEIDPNRRRALATWARHSERRDRLAGCGKSR